MNLPLLLVCLCVLSVCMCICECVNVWYTYCAGRRLGSDDGDEKAQEGRRGEGLHGTRIVVGKEIFQAFGVWLVARCGECVMCLFVWE